jgi:hypothetical protein
MNAEKVKEKGMNMDRHIIVGIHITERVKHAVEVQNVLTDLGCQIRTRLGLHEAAADVCSPNGLILLEMVDDEGKVAEMTARLEAIEGVEVKSMVFDHP